VPAERLFSHPIGLSDHQQTTFRSHEPRQVINGARSALRQFCANSSQALPNTQIGLSRWKPGNRGHTWTPPLPQPWS